jgi:hypothetical protein
MDILRNLLYLLGHISILLKTIDLYNYLIVNNQQSGRYEIITTYLFSIRWMKSDVNLGTVACKSFGLLVISVF